MPATAGRVRMPADNRLSVSDSLRVTEIWQKSVGYDPYAPTQDIAIAAQNDIEEKAKGLFALARLTGSSSSTTPGACKKCGQVGHLTFQCRNYISLANSKSNIPVIPSIPEPEKYKVPGEDGLKTRKRKRKHHRHKSKRRARSSDSCSSENSVSRKRRYQKKKRRRSSSASSSSSVSSGGSLESFQKHKTKSTSRQKTRKSLSGYDRSFKDPGRASKRNENLRGDERRNSEYKSSSKTREKSNYVRHEYPIEGRKDSQRRSSQDHIELKERRKESVGIERKSRGSERNDRGSSSCSSPSYNPSRRYGRVERFPPQNYRDQQRDGRNVIEEIRAQNYLTDPQRG